MLFDFHMHPVFHPITLCYIRSAVVLLRLPAYSFSLFAIVRITDIDGHIEYITFAKEYGSKKGQTHPTWRRVVCNYERFL